MGMDIIATMPAYKNPRSLNFIRDRGYAAKDAIISISIMDTATTNTLRRKYPKNPLVTTFTIVFKVPRLRQMEHALRKHIELLPERVHHHEEEGHQGNHAARTHAKKMATPHATRLFVRSVCGNRLLF